MTTYSHKKSIRKVTDEQFSDGTTIDGTRIDKALQDLVDRFNAIPRGDISTRFVQKQFVFGYQPFEYKVDKTLAEDHTSTTFRRSCTRFPWTFIVNNENTSLDPQPGAPVPLPDDYEYKAEDYGNGLRYKGTYMDSLHEDTTAASEDDSVGVKVSLNKGQWYEDFWMRWWLNTDTAHPLSGSTTGLNRKVFNAVGALGVAEYANHPNDTTRPDAYLAQINTEGGDQTVGCMAVRNIYQFAWTNSWAFEDATIVDDLMVYLRTDATRYLATFRDALINTDGTEADGETGVNQFGDADHLIVQLSVDSPFDRGDRRLNSVIVMQHQVNLRDIDYTPLTLTAATVSDMRPTISVASGDRMLNGPIVRLRDLNIPLPPGSNLRLAIIIPWFAKRRSPTCVTEDPCGNWPFVNTTSLTPVSATQADPMVVTVEAVHGLSVGDKVKLTGWVIENGATPSATAANPIVVTKAAHEYQVGDTVTFAGWTMASGPILNGDRVVTSVATNTFEVSFDSSAGVSVAGTVKLKTCIREITVVGTTLTMTFDEIDASGAAPTLGTMSYVSLEPGFGHQMGWSYQKAEPMIDWAPTGCLTVLQEIKK